jgi:hypothetical protein
VELDVAGAVAERHAAPTVPATSQLVGLATLRAVADAIEPVVVVVIAADADCELAVVAVGEERLPHYLEATLRVAGGAMKDSKQPLLLSRPPKRQQGFVVAAGGVDAAECVRAEWGAKGC